VNKKKLLKWSLPVLLVALGIVQFVPTPPVVVPADLPPDQRADHRVLQFEGVVNFRDLGGYKTLDNRRVKWGQLYRSGTFTHASRTDLKALEKLQLVTLIDFRSLAEKEKERLEAERAHNLKVVQEREIAALKEQKEREKAAKEADEKEFKITLGNLLPYVKSNKKGVELLNAIRAGRIGHLKWQI